MATTSRLLGHRQPLHGPCRQRHGGHVASTSASSRGGRASSSTPPSGSRNRLASLMQCRPSLPSPVGQQQALSMK
jgi:hypothetical protein